MGTGHGEGRQLWAVVMAAQSGSQARADLNQLPQNMRLSLSCLTKRGKEQEGQSALTDAM